MMNRRRIDQAGSALAAMLAVGMGSPAGAQDGVPAEAPWELSLTALCLGDWL